MEQSYCTCESCERGWAEGVDENGNALHVYVFLLPSTQLIEEIGAEFCVY